MMIHEQLLLNTTFCTLPADSTIEAIRLALPIEEAVVILLGSEACLFTIEDLELICSQDASMSLALYLPNNKHLLSAILPYDEANFVDTLLLHLPDSTRRPLLFRDDEGTIRGYSDLTTLLKFALKDRERLSAYFTALADTVTDAVTVVDRNGAVICWNTIAEDMYDIPQADILGRRIGEHFETETLMVMRILDEGRFIRNTYHRPRPDKHVLINASPIRDIQGQIIGGIATEQDITQLVRLNDKLTTSHSFTLDDKPHAEDVFSLVKGKGPAIGKVVQWARKVAATETPVLLIGETGVGKEQLAQIIHNTSPRSEQLYVSVNCGIVPPGLLESDLFGFQGGTFTGSDAGQAGKFEQAKDGTLFLNELDKLPLDLQAKLFNYVKQQTIVRTGGTTPIPVRTRIIAASTRDLAAMVETQEFRVDLYYALNVVSIHIPPLRERIEDIPAMLQMYLKQIAVQYQKPLPTLSPEVILAFMNYGWPGNLQELRNVVERCVILSDEDTITMDHLPSSLQEQQPLLTYSAFEAGEKTVRPKMSTDDEIELIEGTLAKTAGNKSAAAKLLNISRGTLYNKMKEYHLD
ncbi:sigma-54-dependent Fis family transcriptional regulator [Paenibacillus macquariensis subsp. defensor]|nr:sigma-54-dependent Fis family transcriptional regulator [Paenibacillus macquariensis subsp. defensor]